MKKQILFVLFVVLLTSLVYGTVTQVLNAPADLYETTSSSSVFNWTPTLTVNTTTESSLYLNDVLNVTVDCTNATSCNTTVSGMDDGFYEWYVKSRDSATNATVTGTTTESFNTSENWILNITYTVSGTEQSCSVDFTQSGTLSVTDAVANVTSDCNLTAFNNSGSLELTTTDDGSDEFINLTGGNATSIFGFTEGITYGSEDFASSETRWLEVKDSTNTSFFRWGNDTGTVMWLDRDTGDLNISGSFYGSGFTASVDWTNLENYPAACPSGTYITQLNDSVTCTAAVKTTGDTITGNINMSDNNITNVFNIDFAEVDIGSCNANSEGVISYNTSTKHFYGCNSTSWLQLS